MVRKPVREGLYQAVDVLVDKTAKVYTERTGKPMNGKLIVFVKSIVLSMIDLIDEAIAEGNPPNMKIVAKLAVKRSLTVAGLLADEESMKECAIAGMSLAVTTYEVFGIMVGAAGLSSTLAGAVVGVPVFFAAGTFYGYQVDDVVQVCGEAWVAKAEREFAAQYNITAKKATMTNYSNMSCRVPEPSVL